MKIIAGSAALMLGKPALHRLWNFKSKTHRLISCFSDMKLCLMKGEEKFLQVNLPSKKTK